MTSDSHAPPFPPGPSRREFIRTVALGVAGSQLLGRRAAAAAEASLPASLLAGADEPGWAEVPAILRRIVPPRFPERDFDVTRYGARGDGASDASGAFARAIAACAAAGGGRVVVPAGRFVTGPLHLRSNVNLDLAEGATIAFVTDPARYLPPVLTRFEGVELIGYSPLVYALDQTNVAITGAGTLDGQASCDNWWAWKGRAECGWTPGAPSQTAARTRLFEMAERGVPVAQRVFAAGSYLRPQFIQFYRCTNVLVDGITIRNSPMWEIHPVQCRNVTVRRVRIASLGPNNDGVDPESCRDVLIEDCDFKTGDDCIAIKSGRNADGRRIAVPSENIVIRGSRMRDGHGGVSIGSEISGGVRNVFVERCVMDSPNLERMLRIKTNAMRGGVTENIYMRDITVGQVAESVVTVDYFYEEGPRGSFLPTVRNVGLERIRSARSRYAIYLRGFENDAIRDIRLTDCAFSNVARPNVIEHVTGLVLRGVTVNGVPVRA